MKRIRHVNVLWTLTYDTYFAKTITIKGLIMDCLQITENNCRKRLFTKFIQTQKKYPAPMDKISILTWRLFVILSQNFSCERNSSRTYSLQNISYLSHMAMEGQLKCEEDIWPLDYIKKFALASYSSKKIKIKWKADFHSCKEIFIWSGYCKLLLNKGKCYLW